MNTARGTELLARIARCPSCESALESAEGGRALACRGCRETFPRLGEVPTLLPDFSARQTQWRAELAAFESMMARTQESLRVELGRFDLLNKTRARLSKIEQATASNVERIGRLCRGAGLRPSEAAAAESERDAAQVPFAQYFEHALRDWAWDADGSRENAAAFARVQKALGQQTSLGRTIVLGAGVARLAYDLATQLAPTYLVALDLDPFALLTAHAVLFESGLQLIETPIDPTSTEAGPIERRLVRPGAAPELMTLLLADAFAVPFAEGSFDTVVTPWFIDVAADDVRDVIGVVDHLLAPGGRWLSDGPLLFRSSSYGLRYSKAELFELVSLAGFELENSETSQISYLASPATGHARTEGVLSFCAQKRAHAPRNLRGSPPDWILLPHLSVPSFGDAFNHAPLPPAFRQVLAFVDGERSLNEIASMVEQAMPLPPGASPVDVAGALLLHLHQQRSSP